MLLQEILIIIFQSMYLIDWVKYVSIMNPFV